MTLILSLIVSIVVLSFSVVAAFGSTDCSAFSDCITCTEGGKYNSCFWCESSSLTRKSGFCISYSDVKGLATCGSSRGGVDDTTMLHRYEDECPVKFPRESTFLSNWMGRTSGAIKHLTLLDLSLPGSHDTLSYDLSTRVSDGGVDDFIKLAEVLHEYTKIVPTGIEDYIRQQAQTQDLDITAQLNSGLRFLDMRIMYEYTDANPDWYSLHFMESANPAIKYFTEVKAWLDAHPSEIVVMWVSKHGSQCSTGLDQYPNTPIEQKQAYWQKIVDLFAGVIADFSVTKLNESTLEEMISRNHRAVFYVSDYAEFTNNSNFAMDGCNIDNQLGPSVDDEINAKAWETQVFTSAYATKMSDKSQNKFFLVSLSTGVPGLQMAMAAKLRFLPDRSDEDDVMKCAGAFNIPGFSWCPPTLLDIAQLENYYKQITLEATIQSALAGKSLSDSMGFPNAIYINAVDVDGTIRSGTQVMWGKERDNSTVPAAYPNTAYAYSDTLILYNVLMGCESATKTPETIAICASLKKTYESRRAAHPITIWANEHLGRLENWP